MMQRTGNIAALRIDGDTGKLSHTGARNWSCPRRSLFTIEGSRNIDPYEAVKTDIAIVLANM
jgi:hypothetical protein